MMHRFLCVLCITALAAAREKPTSRAARRARKAWLNGTKPPTLNTFYFYVDRDDPKNTTVPPSITTMLSGSPLLSILPDARRSRGSAGQAPGTDRVGTASFTT